MNNILYTVQCLYLFYNFAGECNGDNENKQGQIFVFAIPAIGTSTSKPRVLITTSSQDPVNITLSVPGYSIEWNTTIDQNKHADIPLPSEIRMYQGNGKQNKTIIVRSSGLVSVHAIDDDKGDGDGFLVYPSNHLGTHYYVSAYDSSSSFVCVSTALEDTVINVTVKESPSRSVFLRKYESYRFDGDFDLSGTLVQSNRRISVTSGAWTQVPPQECCNNGLLEMLLPMNKWGKKHFLAPFKSLDSGYVYRFFTSNIYTTLNITEGERNYTIILLPSERFYEGNIVRNVTTLITSDQPVMAMQYMKGEAANSPPRGSPSMIVVPPQASFTTNFTFPVFRYNTAQDRLAYYINVLIDCNMMLGLQFYGPISETRDRDVIYSADRSMCCVRSNVSPGQHFVMHSDSDAVFSVSVYAISEFGIPTPSYAYLASDGTHAQGKSDKTVTFLHGYITLRGHVI